MVLKVCLIVMLCLVLALGQDPNYAGWPTQPTTVTTKGTTIKATTSGGPGTTSSGGITGTTSSGGMTRTTSSGGVTRTTSSGGGTGTTSSGGVTRTTSSGGVTGTTSSGGVTRTTSSGGGTGTTSSGGVTRTTSSGGVTATTSSGGGTGTTSSGGGTGTTSSGGGTGTTSSGGGTGTTSSGGVTRTTSSGGGTGTTSSGGGTGTTSSGGGTGTTSSGGGTGITSSGGGTGTTSSGGTTPSPCLPSKYRSVEGLCGNPSAPSWGKANEPFDRLVPSFYADGISSTPLMSNGAAYANVRNISFFVFGIDETADTTRTMLNIFFLQAITNDLADTSSKTNNACCVNGKVAINGPASCYPVEIPVNDPIYSWFDIECLEYSRVPTAPQTNPPQAVRQINRATSYLDLSFLYGTSSVQNPSRMATGGRLLSVSRDGLEYPVLDPVGCTSPLQDVCYLVADGRSYQSPMSAIVHLLFFREHNRLAVQLKLLNPSWSDLTLYEEAKRINIAQYQRIVYYELLPRILGRTNMVNNRLIYESSGFVGDYDASQNPASIAEFANVVAPFLNSQLPGAIDFIVNGTVQSKTLSSLYPKLQSLESDFATFFAAMSTQTARLVGTSFSIEWKNFMYRGSAPLGQDLLSIDLQKMRDFGFAPYNFYRARCGLSIFTSWEAYNATIKAPYEKTIQILQAMYPTVNDMELFVGAAFETPLPGAVFGPTFSCIMTQQFLRARTGDRYFFEAGGQEGSFTATQLTEIRKISLARMMCNALPTMTSVQADVLSPAGSTNPLVSCNSLPAVNLASWISSTGGGTGTTSSGGGTGTTSSGGGTGTTSSGGVTRTTSSGGVTATTSSGGGTGTTSSGGGTGTTSSGGVTRTTSSGGGTGTTSSGGGTGTTSSGGGTGTTSSGGGTGTTSSGGGTGTTSSGGVTRTTSSGGGTGTTSSGGGTGTTSSGGGTGTTSSGSGTGTTSSGGTTPSPCLPSKYRSVEGLCGNPSAPSWGKANEPFDRLVPSFYADGISSTSLMSNGAAYANVRNISFFVFGIDETADTTRTMLNIFFLQAITNDLVDTSSKTTNACCVNGKVVLNGPASCYPVEIPVNDPIYSWFDIECLEYSRVSTAPQTNPPQAVRQINRATSYLDLSFLYGTSSVQNPSRMTTGGRLLSVSRDGLEYPVLDPVGCTSPLQDVCYLVADGRSYQSPMSAIVHLLFFREHNRLAVQLKLLNPSWSDLTLYEEAKRINIAQYQRIVYYELLPRILGRTNMVNNRLIYESSGFVGDYDASQNPASIAEFANVVAPFLNSQLPGAIDFIVNGTVQSKTLSSLYPKLQSLESDFATFFAAMSTQTARLVGTSFSIEWKNFMYRGSAPLGQDLLSIDLQKMRDFGFAPYNFYRARCGLSIFTSWEAYNATIKAPCEKTILKIQAMYPTVNDMELFVGAAFETPLPGAVFGPTFSCIMTQQFLRARTGDRYFFEAGGQEGSFTATQLTEIRKISLARMMCNALPTMTSVQADVLSPAGPTNSLVSCNSLPAVNLASWISSTGGGTGTTSSVGGTGTTSSGGVTRTTSSGGGTGTTSSGGGTGTTSSGGTTPSPCLPSKYRSVEGLCGNPSAPSWGKANEPFDRLVPSFYADGISSVAVMSNGAAYGSVRGISFVLFGIDETADSTRTMLNIFFLQAITNDLADTPSNTNSACCVNGKVAINGPANCYPVVIPDNDTLYSWFDIDCLEYSRVPTAPQTNPPQAVRQINRATSYLDLSFLYGTSSVQNPSRMTTGGRLLAVRRQGIEFPVLDPVGCTSPLQDVCYLVADGRSYQSPMSAIVHLLFFREHNRLAVQLKLLNPSWSDLTLYEEAKRINIAQYQRIVYYELLPRILGRTNMVNNRLIYESSGFVGDYDASQNPASIAEFANVVAPFLNSQLPGAIDFIVNGTVQSKTLSSLYPKLQSLESDFATFFAAMSTQTARLVGTSFSIEWKNFMYRGSAPLGQDLLSIDLQKMRDFGFAPYNLYRARCGLSIFTSWEAYNATIKAPCEKTIQKIQAMYPTVNDMELFVGAAFETPLPGAVFGPTFSCIMTQQFLRARTGDRYFFEAGGQEGSFTAAQLTEIRKISLARLMCSALPTILNVQADVLSPPGPTNPLVSCSSLPAVNLAPWAA